MCLEVTSQRGRAPGRAGSGLLFALLLSGACATNVFVAPHQQFEGRFIDHIDPPPPDEGLFEGAREVRAFSGQPHSASDLGALGAWGLVEAPDLERYLESIVDRLLVRYPHETRTFDVFVNAESTPGAWSTPYGDIFVALGLLENAESEDEVAFVLAHELSHVLIGHFRRDDYLEAQRETAKDAASVATSAIVLAGSQLHEGEGGDRRLAVGSDDDVGKHLLYAMAAYSALEEGTSRLFDPFWSRHQESEADLLAFDLLIGAGYSHVSALDALARIETLERQQEEEREARRSRVREQLMGQLQSSALAGDTDSLAAVAAQGVLSEGKAWLDGMGGRHASAAERDAAARDYYRREYRGDVAAAPLTREEFRRMVEEGETGAILRHHRFAQEAYAAVEAGDLASAEALARRAIASPTSDAPFTRFVMFHVRQAQGRPDLALLNLQRIEERLLSPTLAIQIAEEYASAGHPADAVRVLDDAIARFGYEPPFLPSLVAAHAAAGHEAAVERTLARCAAADDTDLLEDCRRRAPHDPGGAPRPEEGLDLFELIPMPSAGAGEAT